MEDLKRRSRAVIDEYSWLITLADDLRSIEAVEYSLAINKAHLLRFEPGGDLTYKVNAEQLICDGSIPERLKNKIKFLETLLNTYYKSVKNMIDFLYEFDSLSYRILYEFLTTSDSLYDISKRLKTKTSVVKQTLADVNTDLMNSFDFLDHGIDAEINKKFIAKYTTLFAPYSTSFATYPAVFDIDFCEYMQRRIRKLNKKLA